MGQFVQCENGMCEKGFGSTHEDSLIREPQRNDKHCHHISVITEDQISHS